MSGFFLELKLELSRFTRSSGIAQYLWQLRSSSMSRYGSASHLYCPTDQVRASGRSMSAALGVRDSNEASLTRVLEFMSDATSIPILVDGHTAGNFKMIVEKPITPARAAINIRNVDAAAAKTIAQAALARFMTRAA